MANALFDSKTKKFNRGAILRRAWQLLRESFGSAPYRFVTTTLAENFAYVMRMAWQEARVQKQRWANRPVDIAARIADLKEAKANLIYLPFGMNAGSRAAEYDQEIAFLQEAA